MLTGSVCKLAQGGSPRPPNILPANPPTKPKNVKAAAPYWSILGCVNDSYSAKVLESVSSYISDSFWAVASRSMKSIWVSSKNIVFKSVFNGFHVTLLFPVSRFTYIDGKFSKFIWKVKLPLSNIATWHSNTFLIAILTISPNLKRTLSLHDQNSLYWK